MPKKEQYKVTYKCDILGNHIVKAEDLCDKDIRFFDDFMEYFDFYCECSYPVTTVKEVMLYKSLWEKRKQRKTA